MQDKRSHRVAQSNLATSGQSLIQGYYIRVYYIILCSTVISSGMCLYLSTVRNYFPPQWWPFLFSGWEKVTVQIQLLLLFNRHLHRRRKQLSIVVDSLSSQMGFYLSIIGLHCPHTDKNIVCHVSIQLWLYIYIFFKKQLLIVGIQKSQDTGIFHDFITIPFMGIGILFKVCHKLNNESHHKYGHALFHKFLPILSAMRPGLCCKIISK